MPRCSASGKKPVHELMHIHLRNRTQNSRHFVRNVLGILILYTNCSIKYYAVGYGQCWNRTSDPKRVMLVL